MLLSTVTLPLPFTKPIEALNLVFTFVECSWYREKYVRGHASSSPVVGRPQIPSGLRLGPVASPLPLHVQEKGEQPLRGATRPDLQCAGNWPYKPWVSPTLLEATPSSSPLIQWHGTCLPRACLLWNTMGKSLDSLNNLAHLWVKNWPFSLNFKLRIETVLLWLSSLTKYSTW